MLDFCDPLAKKGVTQRDGAMSLTSDESFSTCIVVAALISRPFFKIRVFGRFQREPDDGRGCPTGQPENPVWKIAPENDCVRVQCVSGCDPDGCQFGQLKVNGVCAGINVDARFECRQCAAEDYETGLPCGIARFQLRRQNHAAEYRDDCSDRRSRGQCCRGECASVRSVRLHSPYRDVETDACDACRASRFLLGT